MAASEETAAGRVESTAGEMRLGLALSGGGFRASLFHVGVLARLAELDLLRRIEVLSCVSGGSIIGALYYLCLKRELEAHDDDLRRDDYVRLVHRMEAHFLATIQGNFRWLTFASLRHDLRMARPNYSRTDRFGDLLDERLYRPIWRGDRDAPIQMCELEIEPGIGKAGRNADRAGAPGFHPERDNAGRHNKVPILVINATALNSGHAWWFQASRMGEAEVGARHHQIDKNVNLLSGRYEHLTQIQATMPLGQAVAASAAVPGILPPFPISDLYPDPTGSGLPRLRVQLVDGGVHDNLGIDALDRNGCDHFVVSDATGQMADLAEPETWPGAVIGRSSSILMDRVREAELDLLLQEHEGRVALMHLRRDLPVTVARPLDGEVPSDPPPVLVQQLTTYGVDCRAQKLLAEMRTDLDAFTDVEAFALMADGYLMTATEFDRLHENGWSGLAPTPLGDAWRFAAMFDALAAPSTALLAQLRTARHRLFKLARMGGSFTYSLGVGLMVVAVALLAWLLWYLTGLGTTEGREQIVADLRGLWDALERGSAFVVLAALVAAAMILLKRAAGSFDVLRALGPLDGLLRRLAVLILAPVLWPLAWLHLLFTRMFLRKGSPRRVGVAIDPSPAPHAGPTGPVGADQGGIASPGDDVRYGLAEDPPPSSRPSGPPK